MKKWKIHAYETNFGVRYDVQTPWNINGYFLWVTHGLCGDDGFKTRTAAVKHAKAKYGKQRI
jgi:hypothetical protein